MRLRRVDSATDTDDRYRWMNDPEVIRFLAMRPQHLSREEVRTYLEACAASAQDNVEFAIESLDGHHIGGCTLRSFNHVAHSAEIAIAIGEADYRGKGYGTDVVRLLVQIGFEQFNLNRIWLMVYEGNAAAKRSYEKAGFVHEGTQRSYAYLHGQYVDAHMMAVLRVDYDHAKGSASR